MSSSSPRKGFTLIELLVVISIIAILSVVVVLTLNPSEMLRRSRDSNRLSDLDSLTHAISLYQTDQGVVNGTGSLGSSTIIYISLPDPTLSGTQTSTCSSLGLPTAPTGYQYQCSSPQSFRSINGNGWIPLNFSSITTGSPLGQLPIDPTNASSSGLYYTYTTNGSQYEVTSLFESNLNKTQYASNPIVPNYPEVDARGSSLTINPLWSTTGLVGYWPLDEGTGTTALDLSGSGNTGSWSGSLINGSHYAGGKVGAYAGNFDGGTDYVNVPDASFFSVGAGPLSIAFWVQVTNNSSDIFTKGNASFNGTGWYVVMQGGNFVYKIGDGTNVVSVSMAPGVLTNGSWHLVCVVLDRSVNKLYYYLDGAAIRNDSASSLGNITNANPIRMGFNGDWGYLNGPLDDVRIYNRALSAAEVQALYNAEK